MGNANEIPTASPVTADLTRVCKKYINKFKIRDQNNFNRLNLRKRLRFFSSASSAHSR